MGYSYSDVFENKHEVKIVDSLLMMLRGENCASTQLVLMFCTQSIKKQNIVYKTMGFYIFYFNVSNVIVFIDYQSSFNNPSTPFLCFDYVSEEFIFEIKTKSFVKDDFSLGEKPLLNKWNKFKFFFSIEDTSNVRDGGRNFIAPNEYVSKLEDESIVMVEVFSIVSFIPKRYFYQNDDEE